MPDGLAAHPTLTAEPPRTSRATLSADPDRKLLDACAKLRLMVERLQRSGVWQPGGDAKHHSVAELDEKVTALQDRIIRMPVHTAEGRTARAAVALRHLAESFADHYGDTWSRKVIRAAEAGMHGPLALLLPAAAGPHPQSALGIQTGAGA